MSDTRHQGKQWYPVQTKPRQEQVAKQQLLNQGYTVYLPMLAHRKLKQNRWYDVIEPLFPRYLFVQAILGTDNLAPVRSTRGVQAMVKFAGQLQPVPNEIITHLKNSEDPSLGFHEYIEQPPERGAEVEILSGPFAGLQAVFDMPQPEQRARVLIELLGRQTSVAIHRDDYTPI
ncbi:MAG: transcription termination/antitermination NusG family protein [Pseudomonadales bacterium]